MLYFELLVFGTTLCDALGMSTDPRAEIDLALKRITKLHAGATAPPWGTDEDEHVFRLHGQHPDLPTTLQIVRAPKCETSYAAYWPLEGDRYWILMNDPGMGDHLIGLLAKGLSAWPTTPTVTEIGSYAALRREVLKLARRINFRHGQITL